MGNKLQGTQKSATHATGKRIRQSATSQKALALILDQSCGACENKQMRSKTWAGGGEGEYHYSVQRIDASTNCERCCLQPSLERPQVGIAEGSSV